MSLMLDDDADNAIATVPASKVPSPFGARQQAAAAVAVEGQRAVAEVQAALFIARQNPRDQVLAMDRILNACSRATLAESAMYSYARGGSDISGPSIRLAEALAQNWGNIQFGVRELEQANGSSTVEAYAWDVETNTRSVKVFQVPHVRHTRNGQTKLSDPRDIYELVANNGARRLRACILAIIPGDVTEAAVRQCEHTLRVKTEITPELIAKLQAAWAELGVTRKMLEQRIQRSFEAITPAQVVDLRKKYTSIKDGMSVVADWFEVEPAAAITTGSKKDLAAEAIKRATKKAEPEAASVTPPPAAEVAEQPEPDQLEPAGAYDERNETAPADPEPVAPAPLPRKTVSPAFRSMIDSVGKEVGMPPEDVAKVEAAVIGDQDMTMALAQKVAKAIRNTAEGRA